MSSYSKFFMSDAQLDSLTLDGSALGLSAKIPEGVSYIRAQVKRIDYGISMEAERAYCCMWQGDGDIAAATSDFNTADKVRDTDYAMVPLASWMSCSSAEARTFDHFRIRPSGLYINDEQKIAITVDPTVGAGHVVAYISVLFMGIS